jgi:tRNA (guanine-N7-)-methyltransferase
MQILDDILISEEALPTPVAFGEMFGNDNPVELEIGSGKGAFLLRMARAHPERNFLGIEWANKICQYCADRMVRWGVKNVRMMRTDAKLFLIHKLPPASLSAIHIYHPDPWPKKRHHKRRHFTPDFMEAVVRVMVRGGRLAVQTDHAEYFEQIKAALASREELEPIAFDDPAFGTKEERTETNYEIKYLREGRPIFRLAVRRT